MERYDSYKDSGVDWIGEIPSHWIVRRNKYFTSQRKDKSETGDEDLLSVSEYHGVVPRRVIRDGEEHLSRSESFEGYLMVSPGELVSNIMLMWKTGLGVSQYEGLVSPAYSVFQFSDGLPKYFHYLFRTSQYTSEYRRNSTGVIESRLRLYDDSFGRLSSHFPPLQEQEQIVEYLDRKTTLIDSLIEKTVRKIELLKEKRTSLINEVVIKGLNPDVEMKDSGVEWIGEIPSHWKGYRLRNLGGLYGGLTGKSGDDFKQDDHPMNRPYIPYTNIFRNTYISKEHVDYVVLEEGEKQNRVQQYDLFFLMSSENYDDLGKPCVLVDHVEELYLNSFCKGFRVRRNIVNPLFLNYQLLGDTHRKLVSIEGKGFTRINLRQDRLIDTPMIIPPLHEQEQIVEYLDNQTSVIDSTITTEEKRIELLKEYRQSLISEVVTGKVKVTRDE